LCKQTQRTLVATRRGAYAHHDAGVDVGRIFPKLRSQAIAPFKGVFKHVLEWRTHMPVKGLRRSPPLALGASVIDQLALLYQYEHNLPLGQGIKPLLRAA
jgi:hypothetical protein